jgi:PAS domain S-box-containing protein
MKSIRSKIFLGTLFLFLIIIASSITGIIFINQLAQSSKGTITDNYRSIDYTTGMLISLEEMYNAQIQLNSTSLSSIPDSSLITGFNNAKFVFEKNLNMELANITETGEGVLVNKLQSGYKTFISFIQGNHQTKEVYLPELEKNYRNLRNLINNIYSINMAAVVKQNSESGRKAEEITLYTSIIGAVCIILTLLFIITFPAKIVKPIKDLTNKIKAISQRDYNQKIEVSSNDEIGLLSQAFNLMAERLKEYESRQIGELLTAKQRLEALVHNMQDGILLLDSNNKIILANQVLAELSGIKVEELQNKNISDVAANNDLLRKMMESLNKKPETESEKNTIRIVKDKKEYFYEPEMIPILTALDSIQEQNMGNMIILKNVTIFTERDAAKTKLISTVSHEMKTPVSSINLTLKLLEDTRIGELNTEQKELIREVREQTNRLSRVIKEILNYSQIETGNIRLNFSVVQPEDIIDYAITALMILVSEKNIQLETEIENNLPSLNIDIEKTVWVLVNILSNAIRYSSQGGKIILSAGKTGDRIFFSVKDFGPGISYEDQKKLFERFAQVGQRSERGWGLGLAISKEFVIAQGGSMKVESKPGEGSKFTFLLPI